jgi:hypothetical protein
MEREPILKIGIWNLDVETMAFLADVNGGVKPGLIAIPVDFLFDGVFDKLPRVRVLFVFHETALDFHRYFHICGKPSVLLNNFCGEGSDIIALPIFKFKKIVVFFKYSFLEKIQGVKNRIRSRI